MSFPNTKTPIKPKDGGKQKYIVPMRKTKCGVMEYYLPPELEVTFRRDMENEMTRTVMEWYGLSFSTCQRFKRELGIVKNMTKIRHKQAILTKRICEKNGYYDSLRGHAPSPQCREAAARKRAEGFHPLKRLKEISPRRYKSRLRKMSRDRKELIARERRRYELDFIPMSDLPKHIYAGVKYGKYELHVRSFAKKHGYILGSIDPDNGERTTLYYTEQTKRMPKFEASATRRGFDIRPIHTRGRILSSIPASDPNLLTSQD